MARPNETPEGRSVRLLRVGEQVRHALSDILMRGDVHDETLASHLVSVTEVRMSPDLRHATVFVIPLLGANAEAVLKALQDAHRLSAERGRAAREHQICRQTQIPARRELRRRQPYRQAAARSEGGPGPG